MGKKLVLLVFDGAEYDGVIKKFVSAVPPIAQNNQTMSTIGKLVKNYV